MSRARTPSAPSARAGLHRGPVEHLLVGRGRPHARRSRRNPGAHAAVPAVPRRAAGRSARRGHRPPVDRLDVVPTRGSDEDIGNGIPNSVRGTSGPQLLEWARRAEAAGFSTLATIGRVAYPSYEELTVL